MANAGQGRHREATLVLEQGAEFAPLNGQMRLQLEAATRGVLRDLVEGAHTKNYLSRVLG